jgi:hypothetical protein
MERSTPISAGPELVLFYGPPQSVSHGAFEQINRVLLLNNIYVCNGQGKTRYFEKQLKSTHIRVSAEDTFRAQPHMSLHRVVNMAMSHLQAGKSVVIGKHPRVLRVAWVDPHSLLPATDDTNSKRATRASYIRGSAHSLWLTFVCVCC